MKNIIEQAFDGQIALEETSVRDAIEMVISELDAGKIRVASPISAGKWQTHEWIKKAILLYFRVRQVSAFEVGELTYVDKIPVKKWSLEQGVRVVPPATVRRGAFVAPGAVLMPSYVNIGSYVDEGTMVDTWATVGSCAQVGKHVHLSGGVGLGGVLEPVQANPVIIEDHVFVGSRCIVVEGAIIEQGAVLGAGVVITSSTKILDVTQKGSPVEYRGRVPQNAVVIPGTLNKSFAAGEFGVPCALIIGRRSEQTDRKTSLNAVLRDFNVAV